MQCKQIATLKAQAALAGAQLVDIEGDDGRILLILTKWAMTRAFTVEELPELERVLGMMGSAK